LIVVSFSLASDLPHMNIRVLELVAYVLDVDPRQLTASTSEGDLPEWDSIRQTLLMSVLEQEFAVEFTAPEQDRMHSLHGIETVLAERGQLHAA
jgi:acyl carrier protein